MSLKDDSDRVLGEEAMRILGDLPGHEFHGNQWTDAKAGADKLSEHAYALTAHANKTGSKEDHGKAMRAHQAAHEAHAPLHTDKGASGEHSAMAQAHSLARPGQTVSKGGYRNG